MSPDHRAALIVGIVVLAGCNAGSGPSTLSVTPAPAPTAVSTGTPAPTGLTTGDLSDPDALAAEHVRALSDSSYTLRVNETVRRGDGTLLVRRRVTVRMATNRSRFHVVVNATGPGADPAIGDGPVRAILWSTGGDRIVGVSTEHNRTRYVTFRASAAPTGEEHPGTARYWFDRVMSGGGPGGGIVALFRSFEVRVVGETDRDGTRRYRLGAGRLEDADALAAVEGVTAPRNVTLRAVIDGRGVIRRYRLSYTARRDGDVVRVTRRVRYTDVGSTSIDPPYWYWWAFDNDANATSGGRR